MTETDLLKLKKKVEDAKNTTAELKGHQTALLKQLKDEWGCYNIDEAEIKIKTMSKDIDKLTQQIETGSEEIEEKYQV